MYKTIALLAAAGTFALAVPSPASAEVNAPIVETGSIELKHAAGWITGTFEEAILVSTTAELSLRVARSTTGPNCVLARVTLKYIGVTEQKFSRSHCWDDTASAVAQFTYPNDKEHLLSYSVALMSTEYRGAPTATLLATRTYVVGPAADSAGTAERLDRDLMTATASTGPVFQGFTDYSIERKDDEVSWGGPVPLYVSDYWLSSRVRGTVSGTGDHAVVTWTYVDGSTSSFTSSPVPTGVTSMSLDVRSEERKPVWSVKVSVVESLRQLTAVRGSTPTVKFGDHLTS